MYRLFQNNDVRDIRHQVDSENITASRDMFLEVPRTETPTQQIARQLHEMGINVFPLLYGEKKPCYPWSRLQYSRLHPTHPIFGLHNVFGGRCNIGVLAGRTSGNLFFLDLDSEPVFEHHIKMCKEKGIPLFSTKSSRGGHLWFRAIEGEVFAMQSGQLAGGEVIGKYRGANTNGYVLAPPSVHPTGAIYEWYIRTTTEPPLVSISDIDWLKRDNGSPICLEADDKTSRRKSILANFSPLSIQTQEYLKNGSQIPEGQRHIALFNASCDMAGNGIEEDATREVLESIAITSGLPEHEVDKVIHDAFKKEREPSRKGNSPLRVWQKAHAYMYAQPWEGTVGMTDRAVFAALVERCKNSCNREGIFRASSRELAVLAKCDRKTVARSLKRLQKPEYTPRLITYEGKDQISRASLWRFSDHVLLKGKKAVNEQFLKDTDVFLGMPPLVTTKESSSSGGIAGKSDVGERGALGKSGTLVYQVLATTSHPLTAKQIAEITGMSNKQVYGALGKDSWLVKSGLAIRQDGGWVALPATPGQLDELISRPAGTLGKGEARKRRYDEETALFLGKYILALRAKRDPHFSLYHQATKKRKSPSAETTDSVCQLSSTELYEYIERIIADELFDREYETRRKHAVKGKDRYIDCR